MLNGDTLYLQQLIPVFCKQSTCIKPQKSHKWQNSIYRHVNYDTPVP